MDSSELYLDGNNMTQLGSHIFIGKKNLLSLYLNGSNLVSIKNKTFNGLKALQVLRLEDNLLSELNGYEFSDLDNLRELYLQNNLLKYIAKETFVHLKFLQVLRIDMNLLFDFQIWELSGNAYLNSVMLSNNPWNCECEFLIPFRTWVASKTIIAADFSNANCQTVNNTNEHHHVGGKVYPIQVQYPIISMCNHNSEVNFNFNPIHALESEILNNHISAMAGGAEKVTIPHPTEREIQFGHIDSNIANDSMNTFWSLMLSVTALIVLVVVIVAIFRKEIYYWIYNSTSELRSNSGRGVFSRLLFFVFCCCGEKVRRKKSSSSYDNSGGEGGGGDDSKLFDAYFIYSKNTADEDIVVNKIAPELETQGPYFRLCLHYRDLCLSPENPWNTDMILSACDASKKVVLVLSRTFLQSELAHSQPFRASIQSAINRHQKKLILILLPPFTEQNLGTIYPELKKSSKSCTLDFGDQRFWSKLKVIKRFIKFTISLLTVFDQI